MKIEHLMEAVPWLRATVERDRAEAEAASAGDAVHAAPHDPADLIADCEAKLAIIEGWHAEFRKMDGRAVPADSTFIGLSMAVDLLVWSYRHRPGWKPEWSPK